MRESREAAMRKALEAASQKALGTPIPASIKVQINSGLRQIILIGPMASGKTRIAQAVPPEQRQGWTCLTGIDAREIRKRFNDEWPKREGVGLRMARGE